MTTKVETPEAGRLLHHAVTPHIVTLRNIATKMDEAGLGNPSPDSYPNRLRSMAAGMEKDLAIGKIPHAIEDGSVSASAKPLRPFPPHISTESKRLLQRAGITQPPLLAPLTEKGADLVLNAAGEQDVSRRMAHKMRLRSEGLLVPTSN